MARRARLVYSAAMHKQPRRRWRWLGVLIAAALVVVASIYFPRGLRGPETVAEEFVAALMHAPQDLAALRAAGHLEPERDPLALIDDASTRIALDYLHARERQGVAHALEIAERRQPGARDYVAVLAVHERDDALAPGHRFAVSLQQAEDGEWRVRAVGLLEAR